MPRTRDHREVVLNWWIAVGVAVAVFLAAPDEPDVADRWGVGFTVVVAVVAAVAGLLIGHGVTV